MSERIRAAVEKLQAIYAGRDDCEDCQYHDGTTCPSLQTGGPPCLWERDQALAILTELVAAEVGSADNNCTSTKVCHWRLDDEDTAHWIGSCGCEWTFPESGPKENGANYCPSCGGVLLVKEQP